MSNFMHLRTDFTKKDTIEMTHYKADYFDSGDKGYTTVRVGNIFEDITLFIYPDQLDQFTTLLKKVVVSLESAIEESKEGR